MKLKYVAIIAAIGAAVLAIDGAVGEQQPEQVYVESEYLTDSSGYNYGATFWLDSTVSSVACAYPKVASSKNVNGGVSSPFLLQPHEKHVTIGSFNSADRAKPWSVSVNAKWKSGSC